MCACMSGLEGKDCGQGVRDRESVFEYAFVCVTQQDNQYKLITNIATYGAVCYIT